MIIIEQKKTKQKTDMHKKLINSPIICNDV